MLAVLACAIAAPAASASTSQELLVQDDHRLLELSRPEQQEALDHLDRLGVDRIRAAVWWGQMVEGPGKAKRPRGNPRSSESSVYLDERWQMLDSLVRGARARGIAVTLNPAAASSLGETLIGLPRWARLSSRAPRVAQFGHFVRAIARRYSGRHVPRGGRSPLPDVDDWSVWNEPNSSIFLRPQWRRWGDGHIPWSPVIYRNLYRRAAAAIRGSGSGDRIYFGETAATGAKRGPRRTIAPGLFVRELACVGEDLAPLEGAAARARRCGGYRRLDTRGLATHFYSAGGGTAPALHAPPDPDQWTPGDPGRPARLLAELTERGRLPARLRVMNTEAGFQSHPRFGASMGEVDQALQLNLAEYLQYREPTVGSFAQYLLFDDPVWFSGLRYIDGRPKEAYAAFRMPIVVRRSEPDDLGLPRVFVWGAALGRAAGRRVEIHRDYLPVGHAVPVNERGYFEVEVPELRPGAIFHLVDPRTGIRSRPAVVTPGI